MNYVKISSGSLNVVDEGSGTPLLLIHGFPLDHTMWKHQIAYFQKSHRVIAPDLRGFGKSSGVRGIVTMQDFALDIAELLSVLKINEPVIYCGLSMGGYIAWPFVQHFSAQLAGLIVCDSLAEADSPEGAEARLASADRLEKEGNAFLVESMLPKLFSPELVETSPPMVQEIRAVMLETNAFACAAAQRGMARRENFLLQLENILENIKVPTLILGGAADLIAPPDKMRPIAEAIPGAQFAEIAGAGHLAPFEKPDEVNAAISEFTTRCGLTL